MPSFDTIRIIFTYPGNLLTVIAQTGGLSTEVGIPVNYCSTDVGDETFRLFILLATARSRNAKDYKYDTHK